MQLQEDVKTGELATQMMQQFVGSGVVEHDGGDDFIVHSSQGDKSFSSKKKQWANLNNGIHYSERMITKNVAASPGMSEFIKQYEVATCI